MRRLISFVLASALLAAPTTAAFAEGPASAAGAGATFPQPLYDSWAKAYGAISRDVVTYEGTGSGDGLKQILARRVDFAGSDIPITGKDAQGLIQIPSVVGGIVIAVRIPGIDPGGLTLSPDVLADLFLGRIAWWDDSRIVARNPDAPLPHLMVKPIHRADASGTTAVMTEYLSKISSSWRSGSGSGVQVSWPTGLDARGSEGLVKLLEATPGAIGYVEYSFAKRDGLSYVNLINPAGRSVQPTPSSFAAALEDVDWPAFVAGSVDRSLTAQPGGAAWPLTSATFVLFTAASGQNAPPGGGRAVAARMFRWGLRDGGSMAGDLDYVPLPPEGVAAVLQMLTPLAGTSVATAQP